MAGPSSLVHEMAICDSEKVGSGTRIWAHAHVMSGTIIGKDCNIGEGCLVEAGAIVGDHCTVKNGVSIWDGVTCEDYVFLGPEVSLTNDFLPRAAFQKDPTADFMKTLIREGASVGANATIICGLTIGRHAMVGAGAVVTRNVADFRVVVGFPATPIGWVGRFGEPLEFGSDGRAFCARTGDLYRLEDGRVWIEQMGIAPTRQVNDQHC